MRKFSHQRGPGTYQTVLQRIQGYFGFTQQDMADVLGVSRAVLTMNGNGGRTLPAEAWIRLLRFHKALPAETADGPEPAPVQPTLTVLSNDKRQELDLRRRGLALKAYAVGKQLARAQTRLAQARLRQQALPGLRATFAATDKRAHSAFDFWEGQAVYMLASEGDSTAVLTLQLGVLNFEATEIAQMLIDAA